MINQDVLDEFRAAGALREGYFILSPELAAIHAEDPGSRRLSK